MVASDCCPLSSPQVFASGNPHKPKFPLYESNENVLNWLPWGIGPNKQFLDKLKTSSDIRSTNCPRISSVKLFEEISNHSKLVKFRSDKGMLPVSLLCDMLSPLSDFSFPMDFGISPLKQLFEKSIVVKRFWIFTNSMDNLFRITITKSW